MELLYILEKIRVPILNEFMLLITHLGEETAFLIVALIVFWCVNKRCGYYILSVGFIGTITNQFMKLWFRIPRPWVIDPNFTILEQAREAATGFSFPSGHTQSAVGTFGGIAYVAKNRWVCTIAISLAVLVPFSRMYIGVHTPLDVLVAACIAVALILILKPVVYGSNNKSMYILIGVMAVLAVAYMLFVELYRFPSDIDAHCLASGTESAYTLLGALIGLLVVYLVDTNYIRFSTKAVWWVQILKVVIGLGLVLAVKSGLKAPLNILFGELVGRSIRYFLIVIVAGIGWPSLFQLFARIQSKGQ